MDRGRIRARERKARQASTRLLMNGQSALQGVLTSPILAIGMGGLPARGRGSRRLPTRSGRMRAILARLVQVHRQLRDRAIKPSRETPPDLPQPPPSFDFANQGPVLIWVSTAEGKRTQFNRAWLDFRGRTLEEESESGWMTAMHPEDLQEYLRSDRWADGGPGAMSVKYRLRRADGTYRWVLERAARNLSKEGRFEGFVGVCMDVTEEEEGVAALRNREEMFRGSVDTMTDAFAIFRSVRGKGGRILDFEFDYINEAGARFLGLSGGELAGARLLGLVPAVRSAGLFKEFVQLVASGQPLVRESFAWDGPVPGRHLKGTFDYRAQKWQDGFSIWWRETTEQVRTEQSLKELSYRLLDVQEIERKRVARELHDGVNQLLASASFRLQAVETDLGREHPGLVKIRRARKLVELGLREVRRISQNLHPSELDILGLAPALRALCDSFRERTGIAVELQAPRLRHGFTPEARLAIYRIAQEALNNAEKHAQASQVVVALSRLGGWLRLEVRDDGKGFEVSGPTAKRPNGFGFVSMRERTAGLGGSLSVYSFPGQGTRVVAAAPLARLEGKGT